MSDLYTFLAESDKQRERSFCNANIEENMADWRNIMEFLINLRYQQRN
jgi:hypothetical protein